MAQTEIEPQEGDVANQARQRSTEPRVWKGDSHQIWRTQRVQVNVASLRLFLRSSTGPNRALEPQSLGRVRDPVRIAEGPTPIDAATQRRHFGFRLRLVDKLQPSGGAWQRPRREDGKRRVFPLHTAQTRPTPRFRSDNETALLWHRDSAFCSDSRVESTALTLQITGDRSGA